VFERSYEQRAPFTMTYRLRRHDGTYRWILDSGVPRLLPDGAFAGYIGSAVDVTSHKLAEESLATLSQKLVEAHETERARIARELHDDIGQRIAIITMDLDGLSRSLPLPVTDLRTRIDGISDRSVALARDIQAISHSLHFGKLDRLGVAAASAAFCREVSEAQNIEVEFTHEGDLDVPNDLALCVYRVLQEAVNNAVKHARVRYVAVALRGMPEEVRLDIVDGGRGFDVEAARRGRGMGLESMQERLDLVNGQLTIESRPGGGTIVRARVPRPAAAGPSLAAG
jgi:signal transduction histidine kinase